MRYQLFLSDFDRTLTRMDGTVSEKTKQMIATYRERGGIFAVCTGRGLSAILPAVRKLGITQGLVVGFQGAVIADIQTGNVLKCEGYPQADAIELVEYFERVGCHYHIYTLNEYFVNRRDGLLDYYEKLINVKANIPQEGLLQFVKNTKESIIQFLIMGQPDECQKIFDDAVQAFGDKYYVTRSAEYLVEIMPMGQDKGSAVGYLANYFHIPVERVAAAGDQLNDVPMVAVAGGKFTVANGVDELKAIATVLPSCDEDGLAQALAYAMEEENE